MGVMITQGITHSMQGAVYLYLCSSMRNGVPGSVRDISEFVGAAWEYFLVVLHVTSQTWLARALLHHRDPSLYVELLNNTLYIFKRHFVNRITAFFLKLLIV